MLLMHIPESRVNVSTGKKNIKQILFGIAYLVFCGGILGPLEAVSSEQWQKGASLMEQKKYDAALTLGNELAQKFPDHHFGYWLIYASSQNLAANSENPQNYWQLCSEAALKAEVIETSRWQGHLSSGIWCAYNSKNFSYIKEHGKRALAMEPAAIGEGNYAGMVNQIVSIYQTNKDLNGALAILSLGRGKMQDSKQSHHMGYNTAEIFYKASITLKEREAWQTFFEKILDDEKENNPFMLSAMYNAQQLSIFYQKKKQNKKNFDLLDFYFRQHDAAMKRAWSFIRDDLYIRYLAARGFLNSKKPKLQNKMLVIIIPKTRLIKNKHPVNHLGDLDVELGGKSKQELLDSLPVFASAWSELTQHQSSWSYDILELPKHSITATNFTDEGFRYIMQPDLQAISPPLTNEQIEKIGGYDCVLFIWAGTRQPSDPKAKRITNGGASEHGFKLKDRYLVRMVVLSDSQHHQVDGYHANTPLFLFHEIFHIIEWAYYKLDFPKEDHPYRQKNLWPKDYSGSTEFDFYENTFRKRIMKDDGLKKFQWRKSEHPGFYHKKVHGK